MKSFLALFIFLIFVVFVFTAVDKTGNKEEAAVMQTALDYIEGAHEGSGNRMVRAVHPEVNKVTPFKMGDGAKTVLRYSGSAMLREVVEAKATFLPPEKRRIEIKIFDIKEGLAAVRAKSARYYDHLLMADIDGEWKIISVLWKPNTPQSDVTADKLTELKKKATQCALDYIEGAFSGDVERMTRALHPELTKDLPYVVPQTKKTVLNRIGAGILIEGTRLKMGLLPEEKRNIEVEIFDISRGIASVRILSAAYYDYIQMADFDGEWKIVNVLWKMNPGFSRSQRSGK